MIRYYGNKNNNMNPGNFSLCSVHLFGEQKGDWIWKGKCVYYIAWKLMVH